MNGSLYTQSFTQPQANAKPQRAEVKIREAFSVADTGATGSGITDDSAFINNAITDLIAAGGGVLHLLDGKTYLCKEPLVFPAGVNTILVNGHGAKILRGANMPVGQGLIDIRAAQGVTFRDVVIDGNVTVPVGVFYAAVNGDPMYAPLVENTSVWIHGGSSAIDFENCTIQHTGGYAILSDTRTGGNNVNIKIRGCNFLNNRPNLFGTAITGATYGSWTGGIFYSGDCASAANTFVTMGLIVSECVFQRNTGNCVWGHCYGYYNFHSSVIVSNNSFLDCGLDCINVSCTIGGAVIGNTGRRVGYVCIDDVTPSSPRYLPNANATFIDHSGYVEGVNFSNNSCTSVCGFFASLDGYAYGAVTGNNFRQPQPGDAYYIEDQIALIPPGVVIGFDCANTFGDSGGIIEQGGSGIAIVGNTIYGCTGGAIIAIAVRNSKISDNDIWQPGNSTFAPILLGNQSNQVYQQCFSNSITGNRIYWSPATPKAAIIESENWSGGSIPWLAGEYNWIEKNHIFDTAGNAFEVSLAPSTSSLTGPQISSSVANPTAAGYTSFKRVTAANGSVGFTSVLGTTGAEYFRFADAGVFTVNGSTGTGVTACTFNSVADLAVNPHTTAAIQTSTGTFKIFGDGNATFQNCTVSLLFNSLADINGGNALQTSTGTMRITGAGNGFFQALTCTTTFNSLADTAVSPSTTAAFQNSGGNMVIYGDGNGNFQNLTVHSLFNSQADIHGGNAFQTSGGTMHITGAGAGFFQNVTATTTFNSDADSSGSPATTAAFQTSGGDAIIFGNGYANFQTVAVALLGGAITGVGGGAGVGNALLSATTTGLYLSLNGGAPALLSGSGVAAGSNTWVQYNNAGVFGADAGLTWNGAVLTVGGGVSATSVEGSSSVNVGAGGAYNIGANSGFSGTLAAAIAAAKNVVGGIIVN